MVGPLGTAPSSRRLQRHVSTCFTRVPKWPARKVTLPHPRFWRPCWRLRHEQKNGPHGWCCPTITRLSSTGPAVGRHEENGPAGRYRAFVAQWATDLQSVLAPWPPLDEMVPQSGIAPDRSHWKCAMHLSTSLGQIGGDDGYRPRNRVASCCLQSRCLTCRASSPKWSRVPGSNGRA